MVKVKNYLGYHSIGNFNVIVSGRPNINFVIYNNIEGRYVVVGAAENAIIWDLRLGEKVKELKRDNQEVTALRVSPDRIHIAVGYIDGVVEIFNIENETSTVTLSLHKTAVTILRFDTIGMRLISGGLDTELVESDMVTQSGKCRLIGHNAAITDAHFLDKFDLNNIIVSSSKDMQIKFWNLETQSCFKTLVDNRTEVWNLGLIGDFLIAGCGENAMNVYRLTKKDKLMENDNKTIIDTSTLIEGLSLDDNDTLSPIKVQNCGVIQRSGKGRVINITVDATERVMICHGTNDVIEGFYFYTKDEAKLRLTKRLKKLEKQNNNDCNANNKEISLTDEIKRLPILKVGSKIKSIDVVIGLNDELRIIVSTANNCLYLYSMMIKHKKSNEIRLLKSITQCGHQSEVRTVTFSSDSMLIASGSGESLKIWNRNSMKCIKTIQTEYILSICFVPGDRYIILGMKNGHLLIADIGTGEILEDINAHQNEIWSICLLPNLKGCCTGSSDTTVKFWNFEIINNSNKELEGNESITLSSSSSSSILSLLHKNTLKLEESVLCVKISPNSKFVAVGLLDSTVKIFFLDSFKFYLSLYGHKLPVLCLDISHDSNLIITGSADRNVKIWGMDFGDCHRSLFAHDDTVMSVQFISKTHMFFTCGKDGKIKQWNADDFEKIMTLSKEHIGEAYNLSISPNGNYLITCGSDRTLRLFERSDELLELKDLQDKEREKYENQILSTGDDAINPNLPGLKLPSRKTVGSEIAAESILECLDICENLINSNETKIQQHPLMKSYGVDNYDDFLIAVLQRIRISDLEEALMILPFTSVCKILEKIPILAEKRKDKTELICKITLFLFKIHHKPIVNNHILLPVIGNIIKNLENLVIDLRDMIGFNYQALQLLQRKIQETEGIELFTDSMKAKKKRDEKYKKRQLAKRLYIQMN